LICDCLVLYELSSPEMMKAQTSSFFGIHSSEENSFPRKARLVLLEKQSPIHI
jgi:hypothetical protein